MMKCKSQSGAYRFNIFLCHLNFSHDFGYSVKKVRHLCQKDHGRKKMDAKEEKRRLRFSFLILYV